MRKMNRPMAPPGHDVQHYPHLRRISWNTGEVFRLHVSEHVVDRLAGLFHWRVRDCGLLC